MRPRVRPLRAVWPTTPTARDVGIVAGRVSHWGRSASGAGGTCGAAALHRACFIGDGLADALLGLNDGLGDLDDLDTRDDGTTTTPSASPTIQSSTSTRTPASCNGHLIFLS